MSQEWDRARYEREKRNFIERSRQLRPLYLHVALIFGATWLAGWGFSRLLLAFGVTNMPERYAISFFPSYLVFIGCVRVWADFVSRENSGSGGAWDGGTADIGAA